MLWDKNQIGIPVRCKGLPNKKYPIAFMVGELGEEKSF